MSQALEAIVALLVVIGPEHSMNFVEPQVVGGFGSFLVSVMSEHSVKIQIIDADVPVIQSPLSSGCSMGQCLCTWRRARPYSDDRAK